MRGRTIHTAYATLLTSVLLGVTGCHATSRVKNEDGMPSRSIDPGGGDGGIGTGIESQDITDAAYAAVSDILASTVVVNCGSPVVRLLIEDETIELNTVRPFEKSFFIEQIRAGLVRDGAGRVVVIDSVLSDERDRDGRPPTTSSEFDVLLDGSINSQAVIDGRTSVREDTWQVTFQLLVPRSGSWATVWSSKPYWIRRRGQDGIIHR